MYRYKLTHLPLETHLYFLDLDAELQNEFLDTKNQQSTTWELVKSAILKSHSTFSKAFV